MSKKNSDAVPCRLCQRYTKTGTTEHHLIPRTCHKNKWFKKNFTRAQMAETISVCKDCHSEIHDRIPKEKELGRNCNTVEKLLAHEGLGKFVQWISKQK